MRASRPRRGALAAGAGFFSSGALGGVAASVSPGMGGGAVRPVRVRRGGGGGADAGATAMAARSASDSDWVVLLRSAAPSASGVATTVMLRAVLRCDSDRRRSMLPKSSCAAGLPPGSGGGTGEVREGGGGGTWPAAAIRAEVSRAIVPMGAAVGAGGTECFVRGPLPTAGAGTGAPFAVTGVVVSAPVRAGVAAVSVGCSDP